MPDAICCCEISLTGRETGVTVEGGGAGCALTCSTLALSEQVSVSGDGEIPAMKAIKLQTHVTKDRTLRLQLPDDVEEGPAEVIVLVSEPKAGLGHSLRDFLASLPARPRQPRTKEEIDHDLEQERESWN